MHMIIGVDSIHDHAQAGKRNPLRSHQNTFFFAPVPCYALSEAAQVLGVSCATLIREARSDREEDYREGKRWRFTWRQVALIAFRRYPFSAIVEALGDDAVSAFPQLLILRTVTVRLPAYIIEALEAIASDQDETIDTRSEAI